MLWPLHGLWFFLRHPRLWLRPLLASLVNALVLGLVVAGIAWWWWPEAAVTGWERWLAWGRALALAIGAGLVLWALLAPLLMALALESLAQAVLAERGVPVAGLSAGAGVAATLRVLVNTVPWRLGWPLAGLAAGLAGPLGAVVGALGAAHVAAIDSHDTAWSLCGRSGLERLELLRRDRAAVWGGAAVAALLLLALAGTVVGLVLWMPALACGAALRVAQGGGMAAGTAAGGGGTTGTGEVKQAD